MKPLRVIFCCVPCGIQEATMEMRARESDEDLMEWMEEMQKKLWDAHVNLAGPCPEGKLTWVKVPLAKDAEWIGQGEPDA